jgi:neutral amino acid transport system permease protein
MRARGAGLLQLLIMSIGLAFVIRYGIQFIAGTEVRYYAFNRSDTVELLGVSLGLAQFASILVGLAVLVAIGLLLKLTLLGKQMRALSDDLDLAETAGIDTSRVILYTWLLAGGAAGLAGGFAGAVTDIRPELGFTLLLAIFAAVILGGIGDVFGALAGGLILGLVIEWSTLFIDFRYKAVVGFLVLIVVLILRPQGIFGRARTV